MELRDTALPDVKILTPRRFADNRGHFVETYTKNKFDKLLSGFEFVQDNESYSRDAFTVRGLHYQAPPFAQDKLVRAVTGRIFDVAVDIRKGSPDFGKWVGVELSADNGDQLLVPKGFLHGFMTLTANAIVSYKVTAFYDGAADGAVLWSSESLGIDWPAASIMTTLSDKDMKAPDFKDFVSPF